MLFYVLQYAAQLLKAFMQLRLCCFVKILLIAVMLFLAVKLSISSCFCSCLFDLVLLQLSSSLHLVLDVQHLVFLVLQLPMSHFFTVLSSHASLLQVYASLLMSLLIVLLSLQLVKLDMFFLTSIFFKGKSTI